MALNALADPVAINHSLLEINHKIEYGDMEENRFGPDVSIDRPAYIDPTARLFGSSLRYL